MRTLRLAIAFLAGIALTTFAALNWTDVTVRLWTTTPITLPLPLVIAAAVILGAIPVWVWGSLGHWTLNRRLDRTQRALDVAHAASRNPHPAAQPEA